MTWTDERPTEPGEYWLAVHPDQRGLFLDGGVYKVEVREANHVYHHRGMTRFSDERLSGALWAPRETPEDPFAKPETMRTDQDGREYNHDDREQKLNPDALVKKAIQHLRRRKPKNGRGYVYPLWKRVSDLFGHGSGYSAEICRRHGFDPDEEWKQE